MRDQAESVIRIIIGAGCASLVLLLFGSASLSANVLPGDQDYPHPNPRPTRYLLLHGTIEESLDIHFRIGWRANNPHCQYAVSRIEGVYNNYSASQLVAMTRNGANFAAKIPIDGVLPGRCQWSFAGVDFGGKTGYMTTLVATNSYPLKPGQSPNGIVELRCKWLTIKRPGFTNPNLDCRWPQIENPDGSVLGGKLWWHPEASDLEVHIVSEHTE